MDRRRGVLLALGLLGAAGLGAGVTWKVMRPAPAEPAGIEDIASALEDISALGELAELAGPPIPGASWQVEERAPSAGSPATTVLRYGPIPVGPALAGGPTHAQSFLTDVPRPCTGCYVTGVRLDLVDGEGRPANLDKGVMLHHVVLMRTGRPDPTCAAETPLGQFGQRFFAAGNERTSGSFPQGFGYHLTADPVHALFDIANHADVAHTVYLTASVDHAPESTPGLRPVTPVWLDENNCGNSEYPVPAGPSSRVARWTSNLTGRIIAVGGHVHDGGLDTVLANETTGEHVCTSRASYGTDPAYRGSVESMTTCTQDRLGSVRAGDVLALTTRYDVAEAKSDAMGIMLAFVYETDEVTGGSPPPPAPVDQPVSRPPVGAGGHHAGPTGG